MKTTNNYPEFIVVTASAAWGLFWIPLRMFEREGLSPGWATLIQFIVPFLFLLPLALWQAVQKRPTGIRQGGSGLLIGLAIALFLESLLLTDVARSLILFYAMPAWGTILEVSLMGRSLTRWRSSSLLLSLFGLLVILAPGESLLLSINLGDVMALLSGILFAIGALRVRQSPKETAVFEQLFAFFMFGSIAALALSQLPFTELGQPPSGEQIVTLAPWLVLFSTCFFIPVMWGIYWGSRQVDPGRLGILLQMEAIVGIGSAALFAGEPFGMRQAIGAVLVISAGMTEVLGNRNKAMAKDAAKLKTNV